MKRQLFRIVFLVIALSTGVWLMSCGTGQQNDSQNGQNVSVATTKATPPPDPCKETDLTTKKQYLEAFINFKVDRDKEIDDQLRDGNLKFGYYLPTDSPYVFMAIEGAVFGQKKNKLIAEYVEDFVKNNCKIRVVFVKPDVIADLNKRTEITRDMLVGFEWCEYPLVACPRGVCSDPPCPSLSNSNTSSPMPGNQNSNTNSNSNQP